MATNYKVLGQAAPAATTWVDLYTVPASTQSVCSSLVVCNGDGANTFSVAVRPAGATLANQHYLCNDSFVTSNDTVFLTVGLTLSAGDVVSVISTSGQMSFSLFGSEIA